MDKFAINQATDNGERWIEVIQDGNDRENELLWWWIKTAVEDFTATVPKMLEYGGYAEGPATDLLLIGRNLAELMDMHDAPDSVLMELGCWFYMQGKVARLVSDYKQKRPGKPDTWFDATVYALMARRIQDTGIWP
jgi:hypothetical protein